MHPDTIIPTHFPFRRTPRRRLAIALVAGLSVALTAPQRASGLIVFDPTNYSQNLLTAARALESIENQIKSLENEAQMLVNQAKNLATMPQSIVAPLTSDLATLTRLTNQAQGVAFQVQRTAQQFASLYPDHTPSTSDTRLRQLAETRWTNSYAALRQTLLVQSKIMESIASDTGALHTLIATSAQAAGALQAQQAGNELVGLSVKQALQTQTLIAAQARAEALKSAEDKIGAAAARDRFTRFIGDGKAYSQPR